MYDYSFSYFEGDYFMSCKMLFTLVEEYAEFSYQKKVWDILGIKRNTWVVFKRDRKLPLKHYRKICSLIGCQFTEDDQELCQHILSKYFEEKGVQYA
jgi:hypothetical protein